MDDDDPKDNFILSQSNVAPHPSNPSITLSKHIQSSSGIITTLLEEQRAARTEDIQLQTRRATDTSEIDRKVILMGHEIVKLL